MFLRVGNNHLSLNFVEITHQCHSYIKEYPSIVPLFLLPSPIRSSLSVSSSFSPAPLFSPCSTRNYPPCPQTAIHIPRHRPATPTFSAPPSPDNPIHGCRWLHLSTPPSISPVPLSLPVPPCSPMPSSSMSQAAIHVLHRRPSLPLRDAYLHRLLIATPPLLSRHRPDLLPPPSSCSPRSPSSSISSVPPSADDPICGTSGGEAYNSPVAPLRGYLRQFNYKL